MAAPPSATTAADGGVIAPGQDPADRAPHGGGASDVVIARAGKRSSRRSLVVLVVLLVLVVAGGAAYLVTKKNNSTPTPAAAPASPAASAATDTALAGSINLRLADLPIGWTEAAPAAAVVRPPVAPAVAQADATNTMAACLGTSYAVVSGLFGSGSLPGQTSLVQSPTFLSAAGSSFQMASRTQTLGSAEQVSTLDSVFTNPKFPTCYQQYAGSLVAAAAPGSTARVQTVGLTAPSGVKTYGFVTTYAIAGSGSDVVGSAFLLGGRVVTVLQPTTNGAAIPSSVFAPAYDAVAARVAAASNR